MKEEPEFFDLSPNTPWGRSVTEAEFSEMCRTSRIEGELLERFWRMNEFQSPMPAYLTVQIRKSDVDKLMAKIKREQKLARRAQRAKGGVA